MKSVDITKKIVLGTAQFGMDYGITNVSGQPTKKEVFNILSHAWENGVRCFDTAPGYGSEKLLGEYIEANGVGKELKVLTKIHSLKGSSDYRGIIQSSIETSLEHLGCPIKVLFLHDAADSTLLMKDPDFFKNLLSENPVSTLGVSVYDTEEVQILNACLIELAFQFPFNVLDKRFETVNMPKGKRYARSIFLQGLLASKNGLKKDAPKDLLTFQKDYHTTLAEKNIDPVRLALSFVYNARNIDYFLIGVDTVEQLNDIFNVELYEKNKMKAVDSFQFNLATKWQDPRKWN